MKYHFLAVALLTSLSITACSPPSTDSEKRDKREPEAATGVIEKQAVLASDYMVAAATPRAAAAGRAILAEGGSAIDAAVAVQAMLTLTEPQSSGIGGGAFILYWDAAEKHLYTVDAREKAPASARGNLFLDANGKAPENFWDAVVGGRSVGAPGVLKGLELAHQRWGNKPWSMLFSESIVAAEQGFTVSERLQMLLEMDLNPGLRKLSPAKEYFYPNGEALQAGTLKKNPELAWALKLIAEQGTDAFYRGPIGEKVVNAVQNSALAPGLLTLEDLANYTAVVRDPVCNGYRTYTVCGMGPPSSGGLTVLQILGILENFPVAQWQPDSKQAAHHFTQASRLAFADRNRYIADSDFVEVPATAMLKKTYLASRARQIGNRDLTHAEPGVFTNYVFADDQSPEFPNTSHISIVDAEGNAVSMTTSIEMGFGSSVMASGFLLNNQLTDFSLRPEVDGELIANRVQGGKRPRSSMAPTMVFDREGDDLLHVIGSPGGARIINYVAQTVLGVLDWDMNMQQAIDQAHVTNLNNYTALEEGTEMAELAEALRKMGHTVRVTGLNSGLHGISLLPNGQLLGGADPRREGIALGEVEE
ncbi:Gamma-glutamyltranspeptidase [Pseudidiomarina piscicola]|uniref:Glutathione hydrolase proenzyme n=1 Tax=Pseudidiomarina piscicola TaxID=2614830 RepID=A0A6S6WMA6_9GAMM|nr:gamma-glutamyltransferase [Pseudidiomarina piscicola]CAB0150063.1 Gamma-glutamyltranspeptidase [Pseudidiomarina piscicola]VZT39505.1 Gamma-glutamyltranspeptidase [Pseudomonas aeruginosa]